MKQKGDDYKITGMKRPNLEPLLFFLNKLKSSI